MNVDSSRALTSSLRGSAWQPTTANTTAASNTGLISRIKFGPFLKKLASPASLDVLFICPADTTSR